MGRDGECDLSASRTFSSVAGHSRDADGFEYHRRLGMAGGSLSRDLLIFGYFNSIEHGTLYS